jgi:hypothetical protein
MLSNNKRGRSTMHNNNASIRRALLEETRLVAEAAADLAKLLAAKQLDAREFRPRNIGKLRAAFRYDEAAGTRTVSLDTVACLAENGPAVAETVTMGVQELAVNLEDILRTRGDRDVRNICKEVPSGCLTLIVGTHN